MSDKPILFGALIASFTASLCCVLPVAVAVLGIGSVSAAAIFEGFRLPLSLLTFALLGVGFYFNYRPAKEKCEPGSACAVPAHRRRTRIILWLITLAALAFLAFPDYSRFLV
ncbi:MAG: mercury transporter [Acidobacteria bacterium]|nr:mercury transporter [Acidobacteriota bacterium]